MVNVLNLLPHSLILYPFNFLVFGQLNNILLVLGFVILTQIMPFATFNDFFFNQTQFMGIIVPEIALGKFIFIIIFALLYKIVIKLVFIESKRKK